MRPRLPTLQPFSVAFGCFAGTCVVLAVPWLWSTSLARGVQYGLLVALLAWVALEQIPDAVNRAVLARLHWWLALVGSLPAVGLLGAGYFGEHAPGDALLFRALVVALVGLVSANLGAGRRAAVYHRTRTVHANVRAVKSRRYEIAASLVSGVVTWGVLRLAFGNAISTASLVGGTVGTVIGASIGIAIIDDRAVELVALDDGLVVRPENHSGGSLVPWRRLRRVTRDGDTLRVVRRFPWPMVYEADLSDVLSRDEIFETFRHRSR